jgi:uncharacterized protein
MNKAVSLITSIVISIGIALSGFFVGNGISNIHKFDQYISVRGLAEKQVRANKVIWEIAYSVHGNSIKEIYSDVDRSQQAILKYLTTAKIAESAIQFGSPSVNLNTQTNSNKNPNGINKSSYTGYNKITVVTDKVDLIQQLSQKTNQLIANDILISSSNLKYLYTDLNQIKPEMLNRATANAKAVAEQFALHANTDVGKIRQASQGLFSINNSDDSYGDQDPNKIVRVIVNTQYFLN